MTGSRILTGVLVGLLAAAPAWGGRVAMTVDACLRPFHDIEPTRSLLVSELEVLENAFTLKDVLRKLARDSREPGLTPLDIWREWWDTQNRAPSLEMGAHCDDNGMDDSNPPRGFLNGFPVQCPRAEGQEIVPVPFIEDNPNGDHYELIALVNRFDMAPTDGRHCGEYRAIFARMAGKNSGGGGIDPTGGFDSLARGGGPEAEVSGRNLVIFEAVVPNPRPGCELDGCRAIAEYWERLSSREFDDDPAARGRHLRDFFLYGIPAEGVEEAIKLDHMTKGSGQLRTNMFIDPAPGSGVQQIWQLRDFKLARICEGSHGIGACRLQVVPVSVKKNPFGELFGESSDETQEPLTDFQASFVEQVDDLMNANVNRFDYTVANHFNAGQSNSQGGENHYPNQLPGDPRHPFLAELRAALQGYEATPTQLVRRSHVLSCGGCHNTPLEYLRPPSGEPGPDDGLGGGLFWEPSNGFTHVSELAFDPDIPARSWLLSDALKKMFLPHRERVFERYLNSRPCRRCSPVLIAGSREPVSTSSSTITVGEGEPLTISSEEFQALEAALLEGEETDTIGGTTRVH